MSVPMGKVNYRVILDDGEKVTKLGISTMVLLLYGQFSKQAGHNYPVSTSNVFCILVTEHGSSCHGDG